MVYFLLGIAFTLVVQYTMVGILYLFVRRTIREDRLRRSNG